MSTEGIGYIADLSPTGHPRGLLVIQNDDGTWEIPGDVDSRGVGPSPVPAGIKIHAERVEAAAEAAERWGR